MKPWREIAIPHRDVLEISPAHGASGGGLTPASSFWIIHPLWGILNAIQLKATNAIAESVNVMIEKIKVRACGFRNRARFRKVILFHKGGLSLLPKGICEMSPH
ncbi:MAG: transposase [Blastocatellia bacterium]|jgi:hypothetical protein